MSIEKLIWIDLEMTGLDTNTDHILEIATVVTDKNLNVLAEGPNLVIHHPQSTLDAMDEWNQNQHKHSGLIEKVQKSTLSTQDAESETLAFLTQHLKANHSPMCGNSICQDRRFMARLMPKLEAYFHYRHLDVSSLKILSDIWGKTPPFASSQTNQHRALNDTLQSIDELKHYRKHWNTLCLDTP